MNVFIHTDTYQVSVAREFMISKPTEEAKVFLGRIVCSSPAFFLSVKHSHLIIGVFDQSNMYIDCLILQPNLECHKSAFRCCTCDSKFCFYCVSIRSNFCSQYNATSWSLVSKFSWKITVSDACSLL